MKSISIESFSDLNNQARNVHRELNQKPGDERAEFTVLVQMPKALENGPLLVKNIERTFTAFVSPDEQGYQVNIDVIFYFESDYGKTCERSI